MGIAPVVALARKVNPLRVSPFVAHKVEVSPTCGTKSYQTYHLVQSHCTVDDETVVEYAHSGIYFLISEPKKYRFITHQGLVVAFGITDGAFFGAFVSQFVIDIAYVPLLIGDFFEELNPIIGNTHTQLVVETYAFFGNRRGKTG